MGRLYLLITTSYYHKTENGFVFSTVRLEKVMVNGVFIVMVRFTLLYQKTVIINFGKKIENAPGTIRTGKLWLLFFSKSKIKLNSMQFQFKNKRKKFLL